MPFMSRGQRLELATAVDVDRVGFFKVRGVNTREEWWLPNMWRPGDPEEDRIYHVLGDEPQIDAFQLDPIITTEE